MLRARICISNYRNEAWFHKLQLSHVIIYRNESERCLTSVSSLYIELELLSTS